MSITTSQNTMLIYKIIYFPIYHQWISEVWNKKNTIPMKYFGINLRKYTQDIYEENYKTLTTKDTKELNKCRDIACSLIRRFSIVNMSFLHCWPINPCNSNQNLSKLFYGYWQIDSKLDLQRKKDLNSQLNTEWEKSWRIDTIQLQDIS